jgi:DNA mismatch repair protein PMS2
LIRPKKLPLTAADEITVMENLDIFASNGFGLTVDEDAPYGQGNDV